MKNIRSKSEWSARISKRWNEGRKAAIENHFEVGQMVIDAKAQLEHGEFREMIEKELSFKKSTAHALVAIATDCRLRNVQHVGHLPPSWGTLYELTKLSDEQFDQAIQDGIIRPDMERKEARQLFLDARRDERLANLAEISRANNALNLPSKYPIILADPPWRYENPPVGATNRAIENHYPTMPLDEICALPVEELATDDAILYLWATSPKLAECMDVITAWGFEYRTSFVWVKDKIGMGYHARNQHELLLVAKRGSIPPPPIPARVSSVVYADRGAHSVKPEKFHELIESFYPDLPKIELFSRSAREGWAAWGNQAEAA